MGKLGRHRTRCGGLLLVALVAGSCSSDVDAVDLCGPAAAVRESNLSLAEFLGQRGSWEHQRVEVEAMLDDLHSALGDAADEADGALREDLRIWREFAAVLRNRASSSESVEALLYSDANRPGADVLNPALDRIDKAFDAECGFQARR